MTSHTDATVPIVAMTEKIAIQVCATRTDVTSSLTYRFDVDSSKLVSKFSVDISKPITVTTQFLTNDGTDDGTI